MKNTLRRALSAPWPIARSHLSAAVTALVQDEDTPAERQPVEAEVVESRVAVLPFHGIVLQHPGVFGEMGPGFVYTEWWGQVFDSLVADPDVSAIVISVDSPGGISFGVQELSDKIFEARGVKPVIAVANSMAASAAYWIATAAEELYVTPGGEVGSVGVWTMHEDVSGFLERVGVEVTLISAGEFKVEGHPFGPLEEEAREELQRSVNEVYGMFVATVARNRGVSEETVLEDFGRGRMLSAARAVEAGMADGVRTLEDVVRGLASMIPPATEPDMLPDEDDDSEEETRDTGRAEEARVVPPADGAEVRAYRGPDGEELEGVALRYGSLSRDMGGWVEVFEEGAFAESLEADDIRVIWQHDPKHVFGRVRAGTARVWEEGGELRYRATPPDAQWARDAMESIRRGDVDQNSFRFIVQEGGERWERRNGRDVRVVSKARLVECGPQTMAAYEDTAVAVRSHAAWVEAGRPEDRIERRLPVRELYERRARLREMTLNP